ITEVALATIFCESYLPARPIAPFRNGRQAMDCDQVFMILTRGPFPTGEPWDEQVEAHLESCTDCWRLAEALRPALEVFQEAVPPAESRDLPGYWGDARPTGTIASAVRGSRSRLAMLASVQPAPQPLIMRRNELPNQRF